MVIDGNLFAGEYRDAIYVTEVAGGFGTAFANVFEFLNGVGNFEQTGAAGKTVVEEVGAQAETDDRNIMENGDFV